MKYFKANKDHLVLKGHYFFFNAALSGVVPFLTVFAKQLGISAIEVGIIYTTLPFLQFVAKPFFGGIADRFHAAKLMLVSFMVIIIASALGLNFIPTKAQLESLQNHTLLQDTHHSTCRNGTSSVLCAPCLNDRMKEDFTRNLWYCASENETKEKYTYNEAENSHFDSFPYLTESIEIIKNCHFVCCYAEESNNTHSGDKTYCETAAAQALRNFTEVRNGGFNLSLLVTETSWNKFFRQIIFCPEISAMDCDEKGRPSTTESGSLQLPVFFVLVVIVFVAVGVAVSLSDALCYGVLKENRHLYGKQRVWGAVGWGTFGALAGYLNNVGTGDSSVYDFSPGFYLLFALMIANIAIVCKLDDTEVNVPANIFKDVGRLILKPRAAAFLFSVFLFGGLTGFSRTYFFWYLRTLGASQLLLGVSSGARCLVGELPLFFFSGIIIRKIGHINSMMISFLADGMRYVFYSYIQDLWWVILLEGLQGGFALFYTSMTGYASIIAPPGTEATMQGLVSGMFEGLGVATGNLLGGLGFAYYDGKDTFFCAGILSFVASLVHAALQKAVKRCSSNI